MSDIPDFEAGVSSTGDILTAMASGCKPWELAPSKWILSVTKEDDGEVVLEWYKDKNNVIALGLGANKINWATMVEGESSSGVVK